MALLNAVHGEATLGLRIDPVLNHQFLISLIDTSTGLGGGLFTAALSAVFDVLLGGFSECDGIGMSMDLVDHEEGARNSEVLHFPNRVKWNNITLKRGVAAGSTLWDWHVGYAEGNGKRRDGIVVLMNSLFIPNNIWYFKRALPVKYSGPTLNAGQSEVAVESIELAHEGIYQVPFIGIAAAAALTAAELATGR